MLPNVTRTAIIISVFCWLAGTHTLAQQNNANLSSGPPVTFASACEYVIQRYPVNLVGEVYLTGDPLVTEWQTRNLSLEQAIDKLAQTYGREVVKVGSTYVLRASKGALRRQQDVIAQTHYGAKWVTEGVLNISTGSGNTGPTQITIKAVVVPLSRFARSLSEKTGRTLHIEDALQNVRIVARWQNAPITEIIDALAVLLRTEKHVWLSRPEEQKRKEQAELQESEQQLTPAEQASQRLLPKLLELLTPEERARWMQGDSVELPLARLSSEIFAEAYDYATREFQRFYEQAPEEIRPPADLINNYNSVFLILPRLGQGAIGIRIRDAKNERSYIF